MELRVLVLDDGTASVGALAQRLAAEGVEVHRLQAYGAGRPQITRAFLADDESASARYMGIVSPSAGRPGLSPAENAAIDAFAADYGVREVVSYDFPGADLGFSGHLSSGPVDGFDVSLTDRARSGDWSYLDGPLTLDDLDPGVGESWGYPATPSPDSADSSFTPVLTTTGQNPGVLMGVHSAGDRERLVLTFAMNQYQQHFKVLSHGIVSWLTRGVSTSLYRNTFNVQIDDVFLADDEWNAEGNCTVGAGCDTELYPPDAPGASSRMDAADVATARGWSEANDIELDMTFNASGAAPGDDLTTALLSSKNDLRWINHTWDHTNLDSLDESQIRDQITRNVEWARDNGVPLDTTELVTGQHSGLVSGPAGIDNAALAPALGATGVTWVAADASREPAQRRVGSALTVPRHPMNIFYNTSTKLNAVDEYNWIYTSISDGGSGACASNPAATCIDPLDPTRGFDEYIAPQEARFALGHALDMDPRPHYAHQSNLTGDRILYPVLDLLVGQYDDLFDDSAPLLNPPHAELGREMSRRTAWAQAAPTVTATLTGNRLEIQNSGTSAVEVPVTTPSGSTLAATGAGVGYAGARSGWVTVAPGATVTITLGSDVGFRTPGADPTPPAAAARALPRATASRTPERGTVEILPLNEATRVGAVVPGVPGSR